MRRAVDPSPAALDRRLRKRLHTSDGLVSVRSGKFDELYLRPSAELFVVSASRHRPGAVQFRADYLSQRHGLNYLLASRCLRRIGTRTAWRKTCRH